MAAVIPRTSEGLDPKAVLERHRPFVVTPIADAILLKEAFERATGLEANKGFIQNPWGFPFQPLPTYQVFEDLPHPHLVPSNIKLQFFGHPLFWIDTKLTTPTQEEGTDTARWTIRMFYLLLGFGLLDPETLNWFDAPRLRLGAYAGDDIRAYRGGYASVFDDVWFTEADLQIPLAEINAQTAKAVSKVLDIQRSMRDKFNLLQRSAYNDAKRILNEDPHWTKLKDEGVTLTWNLRSDAMEGRPVSHYTEPIYSNKTRAVEHLSHLAKIAETLSATVMSSEAFTTSMYSKLLHITEYLEAQGSVTQFDDQLNRLIDEGFRGEGGFKEDRVDGTVYSLLLERLYAQVFQSINLATSNWERHQQGKAIHRSISDRDLDNAVEDFSFSYGD